MEAAAINAKKWMVDYANLTDFERQYLKGLAPFYTWARHMVPNMIQGVVEDPAMFSVLAKGEAALSAQGPQAESMPRWMRERGIAGISAKDDMGKYLTFDLQSPAHQLSILPVYLDTSGPVPVPRLRS